MRNAVVVCQGWATALLDKKIPGCDVYVLSSWQQLILAHMLGTQIWATQMSLLLYRQMLHTIKHNKQQWLTIVHGTQSMIASCYAAHLLKVLLQPLCLESVHLGHILQHNACCTGREHPHREACCLLVKVSLLQQAVWLGLVVPARRKANSMHTRRPAACSTVQVQLKALVQYIPGTVAVWDRMPSQAST